jgi:predicted ATPase
MSNLPIIRLWGGGGVGGGRGGGHLEHLSDGLHQTRHFRVRNGTSKHMSTVRVHERDKHAVGFFVATEKSYVPLTNVDRLETGRHASFIAGG